MDIKTASPKTIIRKWDSLTEWQRDRACEYQPGISAHLIAVWDSLTEGQRNRACEQKRPSPQKLLAMMKQYAKQHKLKIIKGYLYAYRNHDKFHRGQMGAIYPKPGLYRDWHCDQRAEVENSFGFGIWPKGNKRVRVHYQDWGVAVNRDDGKARVWAFELLKDK